MVTFKQWYDEDGITFHNETMVSFAQATCNKVMGLDSILRLTSDIAVEDYRQRGLSREYLEEHDYAILVSRASYRFHSMPRENQLISLTTWEEKPQSLQLMRQYEITDSETGESLVSGYSSWLLVNPKTRRIIPTKNFTMREPSGYFKGHDCIDPGKIIIPETMEKLDERNIRFSDLDANGHTTNSRYGAFIQDCLPEKYTKCQWKDFRLNFSKEAMLGEKLTMWGTFDDEAKKIIIVGKTEESTSFEAELYY